MKKYTTNEKHPFGAGHEIKEHQKVTYLLCVNGEQTRLNISIGLVEDWLEKGFLREENRTKDIVEHYAGRFDDTEYYERVKIAISGALNTYSKNLISIEDAKQAALDAYYEERDNCKDFKNALNERLEKC